MEISVVIPTFNRATLISRAIRSVLTQTLPPREVIVVDDGSLDGTASHVVDSFPSVKVIEQQHSGVSEARNVGINAAVSEWVAFLDSDDEWLTHKLEAQSELLAGNPMLKVCHTDEIWIRNGHRVNPGKRHRKPEGRIFQNCLPLCCVSPSTILIHREVLEDVGLFDVSLPVCEDYDLWLRIFHRYEAGFVREYCIVKHGGHSDQLSRKHWGMDRFRVQSLNNFLTRYELDSADHAACVDMLKKKCGILINGMERRGDLSGAEHYRRIRDRW